ncbi:hypothetical protein AQUCO_01900119v1 [Aquilegia coerulea]|uniref:Glycosyltransferase n=1 Tax=Aquilegia coerulea TaxID=218851 RepID=A0A2G5DJ00_AQUCA|nr:hypothetical protein AQUCO_01900119v1 [Aquilegia coerulea]
MFPWFAMGHITPYLNLSNKLAESGHRVSFLMPSKSQHKFDHLNCNPHLIQFIPVTLSQVGLPPDSDLTSDIGLPKAALLGEAFDLTKDQVRHALQKLKPEFIFYDFAYWVPKLAQSLGVKSIYFSTSSALSCALVHVLSRKFEKGGDQLSDELDLIRPLPSIKRHPFETKHDNMFFSREFGDGTSYFDKLAISMRETDAICFRGCSKIEGNYIKKLYNKDVYFVGPLFPKPSYTTTLEERWEKWLSGFKKDSVVYCAFGSECVLEKAQFQELVLGLELTGLPFLVRSKPPLGVETLEEALPEGFMERVKGKGIVHEGWVQQELILTHPSVGCFVSHCGCGSMWESLVSTSQLVLMPHFGDQFVNTKFMTKELKVAVDVERRGEDGWFTRENVSKAVKLVMDEGSEVGREIRANHHKWKDILLTEGLESSYIDNFILKLQDVLK